MNKAEAIQLVTVAVACFPSMQERDMGPTASAWHEMLNDLPYPIALGALQKVLAMARFFPTVAEIREAAASFLPAEVPEAELAWGEFLRHKRNHSYYDAPQCMRTEGDSGVKTFTQPWDLSHPVIGQTIAAMYGSWQASYEQMQADTLGVDRKHFMDMYSTLTKRERERALLPPAVRELAVQAGQMLKALPGKDGRRVVNEDA